ncbi:hypothetical protein CYPRO_2255 [Cyclonatronum proteinivorum]|uniref:CcmD family protein n=1 Tax=Cyclonatronum proteinivorum TaxID=1457365 RepID=A0A345ULZ9_9BACT|nr:hypothetical protein [Cyclonatronum proteinivorum]AXJ01501.1 hypothetical protein CYPRO_2255 [Cyclonatronum proteinivorum]
MNDIIVYSAADSLADPVYQNWAGADTATEANMFIQIMSSNDLIFVVLSVTLIIWFVLAYYLVRVDRKIDELEQKISASAPNTDASEKS